MRPTVPMVMKRAWNETNSAISPPDQDGDPGAETRVVTAGVEIASAVVCFGA